jgi:hypothetical protein
MSPTLVFRPFARNHNEAREALSFGRMKRAAAAAEDIKATSTFGTGIVIAFRSIQMQAHKD